MLVDASQKNPFLALRKWKMVFLCKENETFLGNIIIHSKMYSCVQYGHIWKNYARFLLNHQNFVFLGKFVFGVKCFFFV